MKGETKGFLIFGVTPVLGDLILMTGDGNHQSAWENCPLDPASVISDGALPFHFGIYGRFLFSFLGYNLAGFDSKQRSSCRHPGGRPCAESKMRSALLPSSQSVCRLRGSP